MEGRKKERKKERGSFQPEFYNLIEIKVIK
jgi:hypothetical protein